MDLNSNAPELSTILSRLDETMAWCGTLTDSANPKDCLRSPELMPSNIHLRDSPFGGYNYEWPPKRLDPAVVVNLAERRAQLLRARHLLGTTVPKGSLLVCAPLDSDICGLSEPESEGYIDWDDVPPWDTWVCCLNEPTNPEPEMVAETQRQYRKFYGGRPDRWQPPAEVSFLLCWVPEPFVKLVQGPIEVNPVECIFWAKDYRQHHFNTETLRALDKAGMLT